MLGGSGTHRATTGRVERVRTPSGGSRFAGAVADRTTTCGGAPDRANVAGAAPTLRGATPEEGGRWCERPCKPDPVPRRIASRRPAGGSHFSGTSAAGLERPTREAEERGSAAEPPVFSGWGCRAAPVTGGAGALLPHRFTLAAGTLASRGRRSAFCTFPGSRPVAVSNHLSWSPDFPPGVARTAGRLPRPLAPPPSYRPAPWCGALKAWEDQSHEGSAFAQSRSTGSAASCARALPESRFDEPRRRLLPDQPRTA